MLKYAILLLLACFMFRWAFGEWPWAFMQSRPTRRQKLVKARKLLELEQGATREQILAAHKRRIADVHPDKGGSSAKVHEANDARDLLLEDLPPDSPPQD